MTIEIPWYMRDLPRDRKGRVVPWFVAWENGEPDFRVIGEGKLRGAHHWGLCWICGKLLNNTPFGPLHQFTYVVGPMCTVNRVSAEPPSHWVCATYSAQVCPFLTTPQMVRRSGSLPEDAVEPDGVMIARNPGVTAVWTTNHYQMVEGRQLWNISEPAHVEWFARGRRATRAEVIESVESGVPLLLQGDESATDEEREAAQLMVSIELAIASGYFPEEV